MCMWGSPNNVDENQILNEFIHRNVDSLNKTLTSKIQTQRVIMTLYSQKVKKHWYLSFFIPYAQKSLESSTYDLPLCLIHCEG